MQSEKVIKPPLTRADSVGVNSRAPRRIKTLFWLFMLSPFVILGPLSGPKSTFKKFFPVAKAPRCSAVHALAEEGIPVLVGAFGGGDGAKRFGTQSSTDAFDFFWREITSASAD